MKATLFSTLLLLTAFIAQGQSRIDLQNALTRLREVATDSRIDEAGGMEARALRAAHAGWESPSVYTSREGMAGTNFEEQRFGVRVAVRPWSYDRALRHSADALLNAARAEERIARNAREAQLRERWALWGLAREEEHLRERQLALLDTLTHIVERRVAQGDAAEIEVLRLAGLLSSARTRLAESRAETEAQRTALRIVLRIPQEAEVTWQAPDSLSYRFPVQQAEFEAQAQAFRSRREALAHERTALSALGWPTVELESFVQHFETGPVRYGIQAGLRLAWPLSPETKASRLETQARLIRADFELSTREVTLREDVALLARLLPDLDAERQFLRRTARPQADALVARTLTGYQRGALSLRDVLEARQAREDVEEGWISLQRLMVRHLAHWHALTGDVVLFPETP